MIAALSWIPLAFWSPGPTEMVIIGVIALLLYGGDLPEVARSWGKTFQDFRRSLSGIQDEINDAIYSEPASSSKRLQYHPEYHNDADDGVSDDGSDDPYDYDFGGASDSDGSSADDAIGADDGVDGSSIADSTSASDDAGVEAAADSGDAMDDQQRRESQDA